jgi:hypothetical protein
MKRFFTLFVAASLLASTPVWSQPPTTITDETFKSAQTKLREKKYAEVITDAEQVLASPNLPATDKARFLKLATDAALALGKPGTQQAIAFSERIVADAAISNTAKIEALNAAANAYVNSLAGMDLVKMDLSPAHVFLKRATVLPDLTPVERAAALKNLAKFYERQGKYGNARETYEKILQLGIPDRAQAEFHRAVADTYAAEGKADEALALYQKHGFDLIALYQRLGNAAKRYEEIYKILDDPTVPDAVRWSNFNRLPVWDWRANDPATMRSVTAKYLPAFLEKSPDRVLFLLRYITPEGSDPQLIEWAAPHLLKAPKLAPSDALKVRGLFLDALATQSKTDALLTAATSLASDTNADAATRLWAKLVSISVKSSSNPKAISAVLGDDKTVTNAEKADALIRAARTAMRANNTASARTLYDNYRGLLAVAKPAVITCEYSDAAPHDVSSWLASPLLKNAATSAKLDRPYGDNLQFLLDTDASTTGRQAATSKEPTGDSDTDFSVACDEEGVHFFLHAHDTRADDVVDGLVSGGSFEMYFAPGEHQAYYTFLTKMPTGGINPQGFVTMYPNAQFRLPSIEDGTMRTQTLRTASGFATEFSLAWELFYDKLPENGTRWQFDAIRWTRSGGFSFGGSESVHNRSSWGDEVFSGLSEQRLNAIKRHIVFQAVQKYRNAKRVTGVLGKWSDTELGDLDFYNAKLEPLIKTMDAHADKVKKEMTAEEVEVLFREAVPTWMEINFRVDALRAQYLREKQLR